MKKVFALMSLAAVLSFTACGPSDEEKKAEREKWVQDSMKRAEDSLKALEQANEMTNDSNTMTNDSNAMGHDSTTHHNAH